MRSFGSIFIGGGVVVSLVTAITEVWPVADDSGVWRTNPWISMAIALIGVVAAAPVIQASSPQRLRRISIGAIVGLPISWFAFFAITFDWYTSDGGTCTNGSCGTAPELVNGAFAAYAFFVATLGIAGLLRVRSGTQFATPTP